jgi:hypothetical protein
MLSRAIDCSGGQQISGKSIGGGLSSLSRFHRAQDA